ncbi:hypothetical protein D3C73_505810 [compost metagenome]
MRGFQFSHRHLQRWQCAEGITQTCEVTRAGIAQADSRENPLDVTNFLELRLQLLETVRVEQASDRRLACQQNGQIAQRTVQPTGQQTAAHGGLATVDHRLQRVVTTAGEVGVQLQVATAGAVEHHGVVQAFMAQAAQVRQGGALGFFGVGQQATGGADGERQVFAAEAFEVLGRKLLAKTFQRRITLEIPRRTATNPTTLFRWQILRPVIRDQQLYRIDPLQLSQQVFPALDFQHAEVATGDIQHGQAEQAFITQHGSDQVVATFIQQRLVTHRPRRNDPYHLTIHRPFAGGRVADLLADHHRFAKLHQFCQVTLSGVVRNPAHRNRLPRRLPAGGQGDVQQLGGLLRVFIEDLVEVAHAVEHQLVRVLVFQAPVLLHHRGVGGQVGDGFIHRIVRKLVERGGAKAGQRPGFSAMGARLPWAVCPTQAPRPGDILYDAKIMLCIDYANRHCLLRKVQALCALCKSATYLLY